MKDSIMRKSITFFMLVTNRDCMFGDYGVKSFKKIYDRLNHSEKQHFKLFIYLNALTPENLNEYAVKWAAYPYVQIFDNTEKIRTKNFVAGETISSPEGIDRVRDDINENYDELWTSELPKFNTDYIATVDADFEVLDAEFYFHLLLALQNPDCLFASTCYNETAFCFDSYSSRNMHLYERNHTWFCIYKKEAFELSKRSHFYYEEIRDGEVHAFDSAAYFQNELRKIPGKKFYHLPNKYQANFIHYGAGSKNISINKSNISFYRKLMITCKIGPIRKWTNIKVVNLLNRIARKLISKIFKKKINSLSTERSKFIFNQA
ncbi:hypothetical protein IM793_03420 [Pedobacter sp. MR2016-19]|uniref:hypothetical protein n=1 Tax=Pedobacter sp. MR2016-19 TaxID=2780089 RepID=UPI001876A6E5|nr:hypothetical protein [Pedobacter sp. MR2016-19]MBE5318196.1 hypothetical protein [Pedobacter sp. MR2016-19]